MQIDASFEIWPEQCQVLALAYEIECFVALAGAKIYECRKAGWIKIDGRTGSVEIAPREVSQIGEYIFTVRVSTPLGQIEAVDFNLDVEDGCLENA